MTDNEKMDLILSEILGMKSDMKDMKSDMKDMKSDMKDMKSDMKDMKSDMQDMKSDMQDMKSDMQDMKADMQDMKADIRRLDKRITGLELHLENTTDKNIRLVAENFIELTNKLNQVIPAADKNLAYEVKVNYLVERVQNLERDMAEVKCRIA